MEDDRAPHADIMQYMVQKSSAYSIQEKLDLFSTLKIYSYLWAHCSNRRHSAIFAAVNRVPVMPLGGSWHVRPAFEEIGLGMNFIEPEFWSESNLMQSFDDIVKRYENIVVNLETKVPYLRDLACQQANLICKL